MTLRVRDVAVARSGDKGDVVNIGVIAHDDDAYRVLLEYCTAAAVRSFFGGWAPGLVERFELPRLQALNFVLHRALDGGLSHNLRTDALGKAMGLALLRMPLPGDEGGSDQGIASQQGDRTGD